MPLNIYNNILSNLIYFSLAHFQILNRIPIDSPKILKKCSK